MKREDAVVITEKQMESLYTIDHVIHYLMECYKKGENVYCKYNDGPILYSCDGYTYDEYYLMAMGITPLENKYLHSIINDSNHNLDDRIKLNKLLTPVFTCLQEINKPLRDELINGRGPKKL